MRTGLPVTVTLSSARRRRLIAAMQLDKKVSAGVVKFVLAQRLGQVVWGQPVPPDALDAALDAVAG